MLSAQIQASGSPAPQGGQQGEDRPGSRAAKLHKQDGSEWGAAGSRGQGGHTLLQELRWSSPPYPSRPPPPCPPPPPRHCRQRSGPKSRERDKSHVLSLYNLPATKQLGPGASGDASAAPGQTGPRTPGPKCFRAQGRGHGCRGDQPGQDPSLGSCSASEQQVPGLATGLEAWATPSSSWGPESVAWAGQVAGRAEAEAECQVGEGAAGGWRGGGLGRIVELKQPWQGSGEQRVLGPRDRRGGWGRGGGRPGWVLGLLCLCRARPPGVDRPLGVVKTVPVF